MNNLQKMGGVAAIIMPLTYIIGIVLFVTVLNPGVPLNSVEQVAFLAETEIITFVTMLLIYVVSGFTLIVLVQALYERFKAISPAMMQTTAVIGFIWSAIVIAAGMIYLIGMDTVIKLSENEPAQAASVWLTIGIVFEGLGGGTEIVGGVWSLLISWSALRFGKLPKVLNYLGIIVGVAGILTIVPGFGDVVAVFGIGQIIWFAWLGVIMLRAPVNETTSAAPKAVI